MGYSRPNTYVIGGLMATTNPIDSTVYYAGDRPSAWSTSATYASMYFPRAGIIKAAHLTMIAFTATGTAEDIVVAIRINNTTDYAFSTVGLATARRNFTNYTLNIPVSAGDYAEFKITTPAWVTNPEGIISSSKILVECW